MDYSGTSKGKEPVLSLLIKTPRSHFGCLDHFGWEPISLLDSVWTMPVQELSFKTRVHITESLSRFMSFGLAGDGWHTLKQNNTMMKDTALHFIALYRCCVSLQIEGKTHYQQKYFNSLNCNTFYCRVLELNTQYLQGMPVVHMNAIDKIDFKGEIGLREDIVLGKEGQGLVEEGAERMEEVGEGKVRRTANWIEEAGLKLTRF